MSTETATALKRSVSFRAAFDKRAPEPSKNYGIGGVAIYFSLVGPKGAISWELLTDWMLPSVREEIGKGSKFGPTAGGVSWHYPAQVNDYLAGPHPCDLLPGGECWGDTGYLLGNQAYDALCEGGEDGLWKFLGDLYDDTEWAGESS